MKRNNLVWGTLFIVLGAVFLLDRFLNIPFFKIYYLWPLFILVPGLMFELGYFVSMRDPGVLVPGGILTTIGILFLFETFTNWTFSAYTWPVYPLSVAIGLFQLYLFGGRERGLLIPVSILGGVAVIAFLSMLSSMIPWLSFGILFPVVLVILGIYIILRR